MQSKKLRKSIHLHLEVDTQEPISNQGISQNQIVSTLPRIHSLRSYLYHLSERRLYKDSCSA